MSQGQVTWLLSNKGANIRALEAFAMLRRVDVDKQAGCITVVGTPPSTLKARLWLDVHMSEQSIAASETLLQWLVSRKGAAIRQLEARVG